MKSASGELAASENIKPRKKGSWPLSRWLLLIAVVLAAHVALIFIFGTRKPVTPRPATKVPELELAGGSGEWLALNDPTLFALPNREGFAWRAWLEPQRLHFHMPNWTEPPGWLDLTNTLPDQELGAIFSRFMQTNRFVSFQFQLKPLAQFTVPLVPLEPAFAKSSTLRVEGGLAQRPLLTPMKLPSWPYANVLLPSKVQVLVDPTGRVVSAVLLSASGYATDDPHKITPDQRALDLARAARFAPGSGLTIGQLIFDWVTVAPAATNAPAGP